jgi:hypothetical protein
MLGLVAGELRPLDELHAPVEAIEQLLGDMAEDSDSMPNLVPFPMAAGTAGVA